MTHRWFVPSEELFEKFVDLYPELLYFCVWYQRFSVKFAYETVTLSSNRSKAKSIVYRPRNTQHFFCCETFNNIKNLG